MPISQKNRIAKITTPAGADVLVLNRVVVSEQLGQPFRIEADLLSEDYKLKFESLIGQNVTITMMTRGDKPRYFNGIVSRFTQMGQETRFAAYRAEIVPQLWVLSRTYRSRIFQKLSVPDILKKVLTGLETEWALTGSFQPRDYCVQYRETDLNFAARLMEEEGIYYFFKHSDGHHKMVIANHPGAHDFLLPDYKDIAFRPYTGRPTGSEFIFDWVRDKLLLPATYTHTDYDFESPKKNLLTRSEKAREHALGTGEWYDFPGLHTTPGIGEQRARVRAEEMHARYDTAKAKADARGLQTGFAFNLIEHPRKTQNIKYLVTSAVHTIQLDALESGDTDRGAPYHCAFTTIPASVPFRPQRVAPKPFVQGPQTAVVVGPKGEEIYTDKYARVKVQFHWDRDGKFDENSSCWMRVAQIWAGKNWGGIQIPRIGQEVVVDFLEGDPDQPIIIGSVYNADMMPPYKLPENKTQSGVLTRSSSGGNPETCNELCFEDKKGEELVYLRAEKDCRISVENDETHWVGHDRSDEVDNDEIIAIGRNRTETVGKDETITVHGNRTETVDKNEVVSIGQNDSVKVGKKFVLDAGDEIVLKTGMASITMKKDGTIEIKGKDITIQGIGQIAVKAAANMTLKGLMIAIN